MVKCQGVPVSTFTHVMSFMRTLDFSSVPGLRCQLPIISESELKLTPEWQMEPGIYGDQQSDGISYFEEAIVTASELPLSQGRDFLFATGTRPGRSRVLGLALFTAFRDRIRADPLLGLSLHRQEGQIILRYLYDYYEVNWMECLRRIFKGPHGRSYENRSLLLMRTPLGEWFQGSCSLHLKRDNTMLALASPRI